MIANYSQARLESLSAVLAGVKDIRAAVERAQAARAEKNQATILFVDEVHRLIKPSKMFYWATCRRWHVNLNWRDH